MRTRSLAGAVVMALAAALLLTAPALAVTAAGRALPTGGAFPTPSSGSGSKSTSPSRLKPGPYSSPYAHSYIDPFADPGWQPARTDMGVDWIPTKVEPVLAIGNAIVLGSDWHAHWPGGRIIWYQLLDGSHAGDIIYVAENLRHILPVGTQVHRGQKIADALPKYPYTEWGWATQYGSPIAFPCYHEGGQTASGKRMARFMMELGAQPLDDPGRVTANGPTGKPC